MLTLFKKLTIPNQVIKCVKSIIVIMPTSW